LVIMCRIVKVTVLWLGSIAHFMDSFLPDQF